MIGCARPRACLRFAAALAAATALAGCSQDLSRTFGFTRDAPDEFTVTTRAPLSMPPSYTLRPPRPGAPRPQEVSERQKAEQALVPEQALGAQAASSPSPGQEALLGQAGPAAPKDIRAEVDQEAAADAPGHSFTDKLLFWRTPPQPGIVVDPTKEAQRLRQNAALGRSVEDGDTPIIQPKQKGLLEGLF